MHLKKIWTALVAIGCCGTPWAHADDNIYSWEDKEGNIHFVDSLEMVPQPYRAAARERAEKGEIAGDSGGGTFNIVTMPAANVPAASSADGAAAAPTEGFTADATSASSTGAPADAPAAAGKTTPKDKAYWQGRLQDWRDRKAQAQADLQALDEEVLKTRTTTPANFQQILTDLAAKRSSLQAQIDEADHMVSEVIPTEARKADVPAGWLRN